VVDANDGVLSLREAVALANDSRGLDTITFAPSLLGGTINLVPRSPLIITDDLVIDGDPLDRGAGGITISGGGFDQDWGWQDGPDYGRLMSPLELRGGRGEITVSFEDLTIQRFFEVGPGIDGEKAAVNLTRVALDRLDQSGIQTDGFVALQDTNISSIGWNYGWGVVSDTGISVVDSRLEDIGGQFDALALKAPKVSLLRSTIDRLSGSDSTIGVRGDDVSIVDSTISRVVGVTGVYVDFGESAAIMGKKLFIDNSTIAGSSLGSIVRPLAAVDGQSVTIRNSTIADNTGPAYGSPAWYLGTFRGTYGVRGDDVTIINSIVVGNGADGRSDIALGTTISSNGHNIFTQGLASVGDSPALPGRQS
jgi:hypothetical protein